MLTEGRVVSVRMGGGREKEWKGGNEL